MAKIREFLSKPLVTAMLLVLAVVLLFGGAVGSTRAALSEFSEFYDSEVELPTIGVALLENGKPVSGTEALLKDFLGNDTELHPGKRYEEKLAVTNNGGIDEFVRVTVHAYWLAPDGKKAPEMDSKWIELGFVENGGWSIDQSSSTEERTVLYYGQLLPSGATTGPFLESITVNGDVAKKVTQEKTVDGNLTTITTTFDYDGYKLCIKAKVDSVQSHNAQEAAKSAWGANVAISGSTLSIG